MNTTKKLQNILSQVINIPSESISPENATYR